MSGDEVTVRIPAQTRFIALARVTAAGAAAELDFSIDEVDDFRMAANEVVAIVQEWAADHGLAEVEISYLLSADEIEMTARATGSDETVSFEVDELTRQILGSVVDEFDIGAGLVRVLKRRQPT